MVLPVIAETSRNHAWDLRREAADRRASHSRGGRRRLARASRAFARRNRRSLPQLTLGDVYAALAYYHDHGDAIRQSMREDAEFAESLRARNASKRLKG